MMPIYDPKKTELELLAHAITDEKVIKNYIEARQDFERLKSRIDKTPAVGHAMIRGDNIELAIQYFPDQLRRWLNRTLKLLSPGLTLVFDGEEAVKRSQTIKEGQLSKGEIYCAASGSWAAVSSHPANYQTTEDMQLLEAHAQEMVQRMEKTTIFDLGPGDMQKARLLMSTARNDGLRLHWVLCEICPSIHKDAKELYANHRDQRINAFHMDLVKAARVFHLVEGPKSYLSFNSVISNAPRAETVRNLKALNMKKGDVLYLSQDGHDLNDERKIENMYHPAFDSVLEAGPFKNSELGCKLTSDDEGVQHWFVAKDEAMNAKFTPFVSYKYSPTEVNLRCNLAGLVVVHQWRQAGTYLYQIEAL